MQEEIKIRGNKSHFQKNLYLCWIRECLTEQGDIGGLRKLGRIESKLRFQFCKQLCTWLIGVCKPGWLFHSCPQTLKAGHTRVRGTERSGDAGGVIPPVYPPSCSWGWADGCGQLPRHRSPSQRVQQRHRGQGGGHDAVASATSSASSRLSPWQGGWSGRSVMCSSGAGVQ